MACLSSLPSELLTQIITDPTLPLASLRSLRASSHRLASLTTPTLFSHLWLVYGVPDGDDDTISDTARDHNMYWRTYVRFRTQLRIKKMINAGYIKYVRHLTIFDGATYRARTVDMVDRLEEQLDLLKSVLVAVLPQLRSLRIRLNTANFYDKDFIEERSLLAEVLEQAISTGGLISPSTGEVTPALLPKTCPVHMSLNIVLLPLPNIAERLTTLSVTHQYVSPIITLSDFITRCVNLTSLLLDLDNRAALPIDFTLPKLQVFGLAELRVSSSELAGFLERHAPKLQNVAFENVQLASTSDGESEGWMEVVDVMKAMEVLTTVRGWFRHGGYVESFYDGLGTYISPPAMAARLAVEKEMWKDLFVIINKRRMVMRGRGLEQAMGALTLKENNNEEEWEDLAPEFYPVLRESNDETMRWTRCSRGGISLYGECAGNTKGWCGERWVH